MDYLPVFAGLLMTCPLMAMSQVVHPGGAATVAVNWNPAPHFYYNNPDSLALDLDGDQLPDVKFVASGNSRYFPNDTPGREVFFTVQVRRSDTQLAADSAALGSAHRFQAGAQIGHGVQWVSPMGYAAAYLTYFPSVSGIPGVLAKGFFRDGQAGYVVVRKQAVGSAWRYWWIQVANQYDAATTTQQAHVSFYGSSLGQLLATVPLTTSTSKAYPNPTTGDWQLPAGSTGAYRLFDSMGHLLGQGQVRPGQLVVEGRALAPGLYRLERSGPGYQTWQVLSKQ